MAFWFPMLPSQAGCGRRWHFNNSTQFSSGLSQMSWLHMASLCCQTQQNRDKSPSSVWLLMLPESGQGRLSDSTGRQWGFGCLPKMRETSPLYQVIQFSHCSGLQQKPPQNKESLLKSLLGPGVARRLFHRPQVQQCGLTSSQSPDCEHPRLVL